MTDYYALAAFASAKTKKWSTIFKGRMLATAFSEQIKDQLSIQPHASLFSSDTDMVVFGSLARQECTSGSDIDWTLLIDGQANADHLVICDNFQQSLHDIFILNGGHLKELTNKYAIF